MVSMDLLGGFEAQMVVAEVGCLGGGPVYGVYEARKHFERILDPAVNPKVHDVSHNRLPVGSRSTTQWPPAANDCFGGSSSPTLHVGIEVPLAEVLPFVFIVGGLPLGWERWWDTMHAVWVRCGHWRPTTGLPPPCCWVLGGLHTEHL